MKSRFRGGSWKPLATVKEGQWLLDISNPRFDRRVVEIGHGALDNSLKVKTDFGNGGEPAVSFYAPTDLVLVGSRTM